MAYTPTEWLDGDLITAERMNKIEDGIVNAGSGESGGSGNYIVHADPSTFTLDKTAQEIYNAMADDLSCFINTVQSAIGVVQRFTIDVVDMNGKTVIALSNGIMFTFVFDTPSDYPVFETATPLYSTSGDSGAA